MMVYQYRLAGEQHIRTVRAPTNADDKALRTGLQAAHNRRVDYLLVTRTATHTDALLPSIGSWVRAFAKVQG